MINYDNLVKNNNILKSNPFLNHITITKVNRDYIYFNNGESYCSLEDLLNAMMAQKGYVTNLSLLKPAIESYNKKLQKQEKHRVLQDRLKTEVLQHERDLCSIDEAFIISALDSVAKEIKEELDISVNLDILKAIHSAFIVNKEDNTIALNVGVDESSLFVLKQTSESIKYYKTFIFMQYLRYYIGACFYKLYNKGIVQHLRDAGQITGENIYDIASNNSVDITEIIKELIKRDDIIDDDWVWTFGLDIAEDSIKTGEYFTVYISYVDYSCKNANRALEHLIENTVLFVQIMNGGYASTENIIKDYLKKEWLQKSSITYSDDISVKGLTNIIKLSKELKAWCNQQ